MAQTINHIKGNISLVLLLSGIVIGYHLLCDAHTVLEPHRGTAAFFFFTLSLLYQSSEHMESTIVDNPYPIFNSVYKIERIMITVVYADLTLWHGFANRVR